MLNLLNMEQLTHFHLFHFSFVSADIWNIFSLILSFFLSQFYTRYGRLLSAGIYRETHNSCTYACIYICIIYIKKRIDDIEYVHTYIWAEVTKLLRVML